MSSISLLMLDLIHVISRLVLEGSEDEALTQAIIDALSPCHVKSYFIFLPVLTVH